MTDTTRLLKIGTGQSQVYDFEFVPLGFISRDHVYVYQGDNYSLYSIAFTWISDSQIECTVALDEEFYIRRVVPRDALVNDYEDGAILRDTNLNDSYKQAIMILEELTEGFTDPDTGEGDGSSPITPQTIGFDPAETDYEETSTNLDAVVRDIDVNFIRYDKEGTDPDPIDSIDLASYDIWLVDTTVGARTRNLPADPQGGEVVTIRDNAGAAGVNTITIGRSSRTIMGLSEDMTITTKWSWVKLQYFALDGDWKVTAGGVGGQVKILDSDVVGALYRIGKIELNMDATNPFDYLGVGTWERVGHGMLLVGAGTGTDVNGVEASFDLQENSGKYEHEITLEQLPSHQHAGGWGESIDRNWPFGSTHLDEVYNGAGGGSDNDNDYMPNTSFEGGDSPMPLIQPTFGVYIWLRIA